MAGTNKKNRNKKNKSKKPPKSSRRAKPKNKSSHGRTAHAALNNLDAVCSKYAGSRDDHDALKLSIAVLKEQINSLVAAKARIVELEEELTEAEDDADGEGEDDEDDESEAE